MAKKNNDSKMDKFIIFMSIALGLLLLIWVVKDFKGSKKGKETDVTSDYTVAIFNKIDLNEALKLASSDKLTFIYIGYEGCKACDDFVPRLAEVTEEYDMEVNYLNFKEIDKSSKEWTIFTNMLTEKVTIETKDGDKTKSKTKTIGEFLTDEGYTPTFVVLQSNKLINGHIGGLSVNNLTSFLDNSGFEKNS